MLIINIEKQQDLVPLNIKIMLALDQHLQLKQCLKQKSTCTKRIKKLREEK